MRITSYDVQLNGRLNVLVKEKAVNYAIDQFTLPDTIVSMFVDLFNINKKAEEHLYLLALDTKSHPIGVFLLTKGTVNMTVLNPREIFVRLCLCGATGFVILHNHPSGDPTPSTDDIKSTKRVKEASKIMGIRLLDHIIVGDEYFSMMKKGLI